LASPEVETQQAARLSADGLFLEPCGTEWSKWPLLLPTQPTDCYAIDFPGRAVTSEGRSERLGLPKD